MQIPLTLIALIFSITEYRIAAGKCHLSGKPFHKVLDYDAGISDTD